MIQGHPNESTRRGAGEPYRGPSSWILCSQPRPQARLRLFCFPYAGSGASIFRSWAEHLPADIEVCAIQSPGRENRLHEPPFIRLAPLVHAIAQAILPHLDRPFAFFGHSMGSLVSFELTRALWQRYGLLPLKLMVSGRRAPQLPHCAEPVHQLPTPALLDSLRQLGGTPDAVLEQPDLLQLVLPSIRADFAICETYAYEPAPPLACPIAVYGGSHDHMAGYEDLRAWQEQTSQVCSLRVFPGNHFFIQSARWLLLQSVAQELL